LKHPGHDMLTSIRAMTRTFHVVYVTICMRAAGMGISRYISDA
jgi:hypothetical protein